MKNNGADFYFYAIILRLEIDLAGYTSAFLPGIGTQGNKHTDIIPRGIISKCRRTDDKCISWTERIFYCCFQAAIKVSKPI